VPPEEQAELEAQRPTIKAKLWNVRDKLKENRKHKEDPSTNEPIKIDWQSISDLAQQTLKEPYKDVQVAAHLAEALVVRHGLTGLREGLHFIRRLVEERWDYLISPFEGDDPQVATALEWLDDPEGGAKFPNKVRSAPLFQGKWSYLDWRPNERGQAPATRGDFDKAAAEASLEECQRVVADLTFCLDQLELLNQALISRLGREATPGMTGLRQALEECRHLVLDIMKNKQPPTEGSPEGDAAGAAAGTGSFSGVAASREAIYRQLKMAADALQRLEPHSPVPYFIHRAVALGALPFPEMIRGLIRDETVLSELSRELGMKESPASHTEE
jgi:type VI secretion system protein ImpA